MNLAPYATHWTVFHQKQIADFRICIEATSQEERDATVASMLQGSGFSVTVCQSDLNLERPNARLSEEKSTAGMDYWIHQSASLDANSITKAIEDGAADYVLHSTEAELVVRRIVASIDAYLSAQLFGELMADLKRFVHSDSHAAPMLQTFQKFLVDLRVVPPPCPAICAVDTDLHVALAFAESLHGAGVPSIARTPDGAVEHFQTTSAADLAVVNFAAKGAEACVHQLRQLPSKLPILASLPSWDPEQVSLAIAAGVSDIISPENEGIAASTGRVRNTLRMVRRERFYWEAIGELSRLVSERSPDYDESLIFAPESSPI